jgi:predicted PurR-regulated permease PerM
MRPLVKTTLVVTSVVMALVALGLGAFAARWMLLLALIAIGTGTLLASPLRTLERKLHVPSSVGAILFLVILVGGLTGIGFLLSHLFSDQAEAISSDLPGLLDKARDQLSAILSRLGISSGLKSLNVGALTSQAGAAVIHGAKIGAGVGAGLLYLLACSLYLATSPERYVDSFMSLAPKRFRRRIREVLNLSAYTLRHWFRAQLIAMLGVGICASVGFLIIGVKYWFLLGVLTSVLDIIPLVGPTIAAAAALLVALGTQSSQVPWIIANFLVVEAIEAKVIVPLVMRGRIELPPFQLLTFMYVLGEWFGILGVFIAPPLLAVLRAVYLSVYVPSINSEPVPEIANALPKSHPKAA